MRFPGRLAMAVAAFSLIAPVETGFVNLPGSAAHAADSGKSARSGKSSKSSNSESSSKSGKSSRSSKGAGSKASKSSKPDKSSKKSKSAHKGAKSADKGAKSTRGRRKAESAARGLTAGAALAMTEAVAGEPPVVEIPGMGRPVVLPPGTEPPGAVPPAEPPTAVGGTDPVPETPTQVDGPIPDVDGTVDGEDTPTQVDGPLPDKGGSTGSGETDEGTDAGDEDEPRGTPTRVDGPTPDLDGATGGGTGGSDEGTAGSGNTDAGVKPGTSPGTKTGTGGSGGSGAGGKVATDTGASPGGSAKDGAATGGSDRDGDQSPVGPVVDGPVAPVEAARPASGVQPARAATPAAVTSNGGEGEASSKPSLKSVIESVLGGRTQAPTRTETAAPAAAAPVAKAPVAKAPVAKAPVAKAPVAKAPVAKAPVVAPVAPPVVAPVVTTKAKVAPVEPAIARTAPRIDLSSGGSGQSYRQYEITALGLTRESRQVANALGFRILSERKSPLLGDRIVARLRTPSGQTAKAALARIRSVLPEMTFDYSHLYRPSGETGSASVRYAVAMIGAPAGDAGACNASTRVGLIDSGVGAHPTLASARILRKNFIEKNAATNVTHGTAIASILVGDLPGSGPLLSGGQLYSANVFAQDGQGLRADPAAIIEALDWMAQNRVPVVNLSLMGPDNDLLTRAVRAAAQRGLVLVAAAGNDGPSGAPAYPAAYPEVIAVSAVDSRGRPYARNNRGGYVYVSAPGVDVWGADARGGLAFWTGTSFAAPFVTASIARDLAQGRVSNINDGRRRLASTARDMGAPGRDPIYGYGLLQLSGCGAGGGATVVSSKSR